MSYTNLIIIVFLRIQKLLGTASPKTIAKAIVEGIRHNSRCISIPGYLLPIARVIRLAFLLSTITDVSNQDDIK